jgi:hypothetical protein
LGGRIRVAGTRVQGDVREIETFYMRCAAKGYPERMMEEVNS